MSTRNGVVVRPAIPDDAAALADLWTATDESSDQPGDQPSERPHESPPTAAETANALEYNSSVNGHHVTVALIEGAVVGAAVHQIATVTPVSVSKALAILDLRTSGSRRKRAAELALLGHLAELAHEMSCEFVVASAPASDREAHRLLAKLGFSQSAVVRAVAVSRLMARVSSANQPTTRDTSRLLAVRRTMRRRQDARSSEVEPSA